MDDRTTPIAHLRDAVRHFVAERCWEPFHTPKNLVMALSVEASELVEIFQWLTPEESLDIHRDPARLQHVQEEMADVCCYLLSLANQLDIDLATAVQQKMIKNAIKYPPPAKSTSGSSQEKK